MAIRFQRLFVLLLLFESLTVLLVGSEVPLLIDYAMLQALCALAQEELPIHVPHLESNDVLYGGDEMYMTDLYGMLDECVGHILEQIATLKTTNVDLQSVLGAEFFDLTVALSELNAKSANLAVNVLTLAKQGGVNAHLTRAFAAMRFREESSPYQRQMLAKLSL
jgi:hypothetical protein